MLVSTSEVDTASDSAQGIDAEDVLALAASNPNATAEVLEALAKSTSSYVRSKVAENEHTPPLVLDALMHDCTAVRAALAHNPKAIERVWSLVQDENPKVRMMLAANPNLPDHVYQVLQNDANKYVARRARRTLGQVRKSDNPVVSLVRIFSKAS